MLTTYIILVLISFLTVFGLLVGWTWRDGRLPATVSDMAYNHVEKSRRAHYTLWLWAATFTLTPALFYLIPEEWEGLAHAYATSIVFCGIMPLVARHRNLTFVVFGLAAGVFSQCCVIALCPWWMLVWTHLGALVAFVDRRDTVPAMFVGKGVMVIEFVSWFTIASAILTRLLMTL
jgi:hypothetical protein